MTTAQIMGLLNYWVVVVLMMIGFYMVIARQNFIKKIIGLNIFQISVILMYITMGKVTGGTAPIVKPEIAARFEQHASHSGPITELRAASHSSSKTIASSATWKRLANPDVAAGDTDRQLASTQDDRHPEGHDSSGELASVNHHPPFIDDTVYSNPLPSVLMLTAIVVGVGTTALALALVVRIREDYGTIEEDEILEEDRKS